MKRTLSLYMSLVILINAFVPLAAKADPAAEVGGFTTMEVGKIEDLIMVHERDCLPKGDMTQDEIVKYYEEHGISEQCYKYMMEIDQLEKELAQQQGQLEQTLGCEGGQCQDLKMPGDDLSDQLSNLDKVDEELSCNETKKNTVKSTCGDDLRCALASSVMGIGGGYIAEKLLPKNLKVTGCHYGDDSCTTQLAMAFLKAALSFFEGAWDLLKAGVKAGGRFVKKKAKQFWNWVTRADDHASTSQLAMAKASEEEGIFQMLRKDFLGTMGKIFSGLVGALKEWLKNDVFCAKWEGVPQFSKCLAPLESIDCLSCKTMINGVCSMAGTFIAEIVPSFLTGGLVTAAKHGAGAASKLAKLLKVSAKTREAIKASRIAKLIGKGATKIDDVLKLSKVAKAAKKTAHVTLKMVKNHLASPARAAAKKAHGALMTLGQKGKVFMAETRTGKMLVFSGKALKKTGKAIIYPIDNPMTTWAFNKGESTFAKMLKLGSPKLAAMTTATSAMVHANPKVEKVLVELEKARFAAKQNPKKVLKIEEELVKVVKPKRAEMLDKALAGEHPDLRDLITHLYPELQYGKLADKLGVDEVLAAEKELLEHIEKMAAGPHKDELLKQLELHTSMSKARKRVLGYERVGGADAPEDAYPLLRAVEVPQVNPNLMVDMMADKDLAPVLNRIEPEARKSAANALKLLEDGGMTRAQAAATYEKYESYFKHVGQMSGPNSEAQSILAKFIDREKKAGMLDDEITRKLADKFKDCK